MLQSLTARLQGLQVTWADVTTVEIYTVHDLHPLLATTILPALQEANRYGIRWHYARPPVVELECEMDVRGVRQPVAVADNELLEGQLGVGERAARRGARRRKRIVGPRICSALRPVLNRVRGTTGKRPPSLRIGMYPQI